FSPWPAARARGFCQTPCSRGGPGRFGPVVPELPHHYKCAHRLAWSCQEEPDWTGGRDGESPSCPFARVAEEGTEAGPRRRPGENFFWPRGSGRQFASVKMGN